MSPKMSPFLCLFVFFWVASSTLTNFDVTPFLPLFNNGTELQIVGFMNLYKNNTLERLDDGNNNVPPSFDPKYSVNSKDVAISPQTGVSARIYIPIPSDEKHKLPLVIYFHGGGFCAGNASSSAYHSSVNSLVAHARVVAVSVNYREAPENPIPIAYEDGWSVLKWVAEQSKGCGTETWVKDYVDFENVFLAGDSAGGNIAHNVAMRVGEEKLDGVKLGGIVLICPFFWGKEPIGENEPKGIKLRTTVDNMWHVATLMRFGLDDPRVNPIQDPKLSKLGCPRVLVCISQFDWLRDRGEYYYNKLGESGWKGEVELFESRGENHVFHLTKLDSANAKALLKRVSSFINKQA